MTNPATSGSGTGANDESSATTDAARTLKSKLVGGSLTLLAGSGLVGLTNLAYNVVTARLLGPIGFAHATAVYTALMLMSAVTLSFQVVCAKYVAKSSTEGDRVSVFSNLHQRSWVAGIAIGLVLFLFERPITRYLSLPDPMLVSLLALGTAFYIPLGVRRGYIQGVHAFRALAVNFLLEGLVRLGGAFLLIEIGLGVNGAVFACAAAEIFSYFLAIPSPGMRSLVRFRGTSIAFREGLQAIVFFSGQTIINNFDIVLVKHFFPPAEAGFYAAIALVGRLVNMCAWSVVNTMFPVSAGAGGDEREGSRVLSSSLLLVFIILTVLILGLWLVPGFLWKGLFGSQFEVESYGALASLLILYAITAGVYSLASVVITHEMSRKIANTSWLQLAFSGALAFGICILHQTLRQVILVQLVLMLALLFVLIVPMLLRRLSPQTDRTFGNLRVLRPLTEDEAIAEFLRNEFHHPEFDDYRQQFDYLVRKPDLDSPRENALRQALLFLRRGAMWRELPEDTQWFELELEAQDLARVRFFPRAHWRRMAQGSFYLTDVIQRIRLRQADIPQDEFVHKLSRLTTLVREGLTNPTILMIGVDSTGPLTILDGNHRMAAVLLAQSSFALSGLRFICGFSPRMTRCCWYYTNVNTLLRYMKNLIRYFSYDPESDIGRFREEIS
jgi:O-antigen/teichoic acid export membrane protein